LYGPGVGYAQAPTVDSGNIDHNRRPTSDDLVAGIVPGVAGAAIMSGAWAATASCEAGVTAAYQWIVARPWWLAGGTAAGKVAADHEGELQEDAREIGDIIRSIPPHFADVPMTPGEKFARLMELQERFEFLSREYDELLKLEAADPTQEYYIDDLLAEIMKVMDEWKRLK
jgi:hypothetical protein